ncbi:MAG: hypothetical protein WCN27_03195, partial [Alphaproteobacteria bacterium]
STFLSSADVGLLQSDRGSGALVPSLVSASSSALVPSAGYSVERTYALICKYMGDDLVKIRALHTGLRTFAPADVRQKEEMRSGLNLVVYAALRQRIGDFLLNFCDPESRFLNTEGAISSLVLDVFLGAGINGGIGQLIPAFGSAATVFDKVIKEAGHSRYITKRVVKDKISFIADFYKKVDRTVVGVTVGTAAEEIDRSFALWGSDSEGGDFGGIIQRFFESLAARIETSFFVDAIESARQKADVCGSKLAGIDRQISENGHALEIAQKTLAEKRPVAENARSVFVKADAEDAAVRSMFARTFRYTSELAASRAAKNKAESELSNADRVCNALISDRERLMENQEDTSETLRRTSQFLEILNKNQHDIGFFGNQGSSGTGQIVPAVFDGLTSIRSQRQYDVVVHNTPSEATEIVKAMLGSVLGVNVSDVSNRLYAELTTAVPRTLAYGQEQVAQQVQIFNNGKKLASRVATGRNAAIFGGLAAAAGVVDHLWNEGKGMEALSGGASDILSNPLASASSVANFGMERMKNGVVYPTVQEFNRRANASVGLLSRLKSTVDAGRTAFQGASMAGAGIALLKLAGTYLPGAFGNACARIPNTLSAANIPAGYVAPFDLPTGSILTSWGLGLFSAYCQNPEGTARLVNGLSTGVKRLIGNIGSKELLYGAMWLGANYVLTNYMLAGDDASTMEL